MSRVVKRVSRDVKKVSRVVKRVLPIVPLQVSEKCWLTVLADSAG